MGLSGRSRIRFNRRRIDVRKYLKWQNFCIISIIICIGVLSFTAISGYILAKKIERSTIVYSKDEKNVEINDNNEVVEVSSNIDSEESTDEKNTTKDVSSDISKDTSLQTQSSKNLSLCLLGEIMMGGTVTQNVNYSYASAFKRVYAKTRMADFTYANFSTNITNLV
jgi:predicted transport protein